MKDTKHTPGPWTVVGGCWISAAGFPTVAKANTRPRGGILKPNDKAEAEANAQLIARAPELLADNDRLREVNAELVEALRLAVRQLDWASEVLQSPDGSTIVHATKAAKAALAKANQH